MRTILTCIVLFMTFAQAFAQAQTGDIIFVDGRKIKLLSDNLIPNPGFEEGFTGWTNTGMATQTNAVFSVKNGTTYIEKWVNRGSRVSDAGVQQTLTGIPEGKYKLTAETVNVRQSGAGSAVNNSASPQTGVSLFAGLISVAADTLKNRSVDFIVLDGRVTLGFKAENATGNWIACDNFRLAYLGQYNVEDYAGFVNDIIAESRKLLSQKMQNPVRQALETAIAQAEAATTAATLVFEDISAAKEQLEAAVNDANLSVQAYTALQTVIDYANQVLGWYAGEQAKVDVLQPAIAAAITASTNFELTVREISQAVSSLKTVTQSADKRIYIPAWMMGDVNNPDGLTTKCTIVRHDLPHGIFRISNLTGQAR